jgi:hypothetical protein
MNSNPNEGPQREDGIYSYPVLETFFEVLVDAIGSEDCLHVFIPGRSNFTIPPNVPKISALRSKNDQENLQSAPKLGIFDLPISQRDNSGQYRRNSEFNTILKLISLLDDDGIALLTSGASGLGFKTGQRFQDDLRELGWHVMGYIELPKNGLNIVFQPLLAIISKAERDVLFTASISDGTDEKAIAHSLLQGDPEAWAESGFLSDAPDFRGFRVERIRKELRSLLKSDNGFQLYRFGDFVVETNIQRRKQAFALLESQVAISKILLGSDRDVVLTHCDEPNFKFGWIVVSLTHGLLPAYFKMFMNSELGRMCLEVATDGSGIRSVNTDSLLETLIPIPSVDTQQRLVSSYENLEKLQSQISRLEKELVFNPKNIDAVSSDVVSLLGSIGRLTAADEIKARVRSGENKTLEFKETLSWDVRKGEKAKYIEISSLKTIAAFLNTDGGRLLVGVRDDGTIPGLKFEIEKLHQANSDKFLLHFKNLVHEKIGAKYYPKLDWELQDIDETLVLVVAVQPASEPCFLDDDFYVRTNPSTDKLTGEKQFKYVTEHFHLTK